MGWERRWLDPLRSRWQARAGARHSPLKGPLALHLRLDDPYSHLAVQALPRLVRLLGPSCLPLHIVLCDRLPTVLPAGLTAEQWHSHSLADAAMLARQHHFDFAPDPHLPAPVLQQVAAEVLQCTPLRGEAFLRLLHNVFHMLWHGQTGKLHTVLNICRRAPAKAATQDDTVVFVTRAEGLLQASYVLDGRFYRAVDDFLRLTRRLHHQGGLLEAPVFLINHVDWGEHLVSDPVVLAQIQAHQPRLEFWGALEDPLTWLLLRYIQQEMTGHYNVQVTFLPLPYQGRDGFDGSLMQRLSRRTGVGFGPYVRPDARSSFLMARYLCALPPEQHTERALGLLAQVWTRAQAVRDVRDLQRALALSEPPVLAPEADTRDWLARHQQQANALHLPEQPLMRLGVGARRWAFAGLYRVWRLETLLAQVIDA